MGNTKSSRKILEVIRAQETIPDSKELSALFKKYDQNHDRTLQEAEAKRMLSEVYDVFQYARLAGGSTKESTVAQWLRMWDTNADGVLDFSEFQAFLTALQEDITNFETCVKMVMLGDSGVGKTSAFTAWASQMPLKLNTAVPEPTDTSGTFPYASRVVDGKTYQLMMSDNRGDTKMSEQDRIQNGTYNRASVVLLCFAIDNITSFNNVRNKWWPEARRNAPAVPLMLVGFKTDLRDSVNASALIQEPEFKTLAEEMGAADFYEGSSRLDDLTELNQVFESAFVVATSAENAPNTAQAR